MPSIHQVARLHMRFLYKVVHKTAVSESSIALGRLNLTFFIAWTIFMKLGTLVHHVYGSKTVLPIFKFLPKGLRYGLSESKKRGKIITKL